MINPLTGCPICNLIIDRPNAVKKPKDMSKTSGANAQQDMAIIIHHAKLLGCIVYYVASPYLRRCSQCVCNTKLGSEILGLVIT